MRSPREDTCYAYTLTIFTQVFCSTAPPEPRKATRLSRGVKAQTVHLDNLSGRGERRLPIAVLVRLALLDRGGAREYEKTYTDNLSAHGVRVKSRRAWLPGGQAEITPLNEKSPIYGKVVYCQKLDDARFFIGLKFPRGRIPWSVFKRLDDI